MRNALKNFYIALIFLFLYAPTKAKVDRKKVRNGLELQG